MMNNPLFLNKQVKILLVKILNIFLEKNHIFTLWMGAKTHENNS